MLAPCSMIAFYLVLVVIYITVNPVTLDTLEAVHTMTVPYLVYYIKMAMVQQQQRGSCYCPPEAKTRTQTRIGKDAVMILATRERAAFLNESLRIFYRNFNKCFRKDVLIFHNGDFPVQEQAQLKAEFGPELQFHNLVPGGKWWGPPDSIKDQMHMVDTGHWHIGFFHMTRWYGVLAYEYLNKMGYEWFMRMDDDSYFLSCIDYDIFDFAESHNITYAYRMEHVDDGTGPFTDIIQEAMDDWGMPTPEKLLDRFAGRDFKWEKWDGRHYYNNFCLTKVSFWMSEPVQYLLRKIDGTGYQYTRRVLDAPLQSLLVLLLIPEEQIFKYPDWSYSHHPKMVLTFYSLLPSAVVSAMSWVGFPDFEILLQLEEGKHIRFFLDVQKVFGKGSKWYRALRR
mmetsp:Transcript_113964/g.302879  ORF Transcript_113964/g.302879 Transcript_113964/m.302879 type:complete len:395 (-) Transcript_113964:253-1437(-)